jgi:glycosyltransferase involved in cell wall biosynthesis
VIQITAIVCTRNRADMLARAIDSLAAQSLPAEQYEILIVDNGSTDNTSELVRKRAVRHGNLRYISELEAGLSRARNAGLEQAHSALAAFMDDDATASPDWLEGICRVFANRRPQPGLVCGPVKAEWGGARPSWLKDYWLPFYSIVSWSAHARCLAADEWVVGTNFAVPTTLAIDCGGFDTSLGRRGTVLLGDEELALTDNIRGAGYEIYYDPEISVDHYIPADRLSRTWFYRRVFWGAVSASTRQRQMLTSKRERYQRAAKAARGALRYAWSLRQFRESDTERVLRYHQVAEKLGEMRGYLIGSAGLS